MKKTLVFGATTVAGLVLLAGSLTTVDAQSRGLNGPDVTASRVGLDDFNSTDDFAYYGTVGGIRGYSMASTSCNSPWESNPVPDTTADWIDQPGNARNPVIAQNLYRMARNGNRLEQIGMSWLKHSFCAVSEDTCGNCNGTSCNSLGIGCADTYWATLNGGPSRVGPRWEINPVGVGPGGVHDDIYTNPSGSDIAGKLQVAVADIISGDKYFAEIQYVTHDEEFQRRWNNASYRQVVFNGTTMSGATPGQASVQRGYSGIQAWQDNNPSVEIVRFEDDPGVGRFELAYLVIDNGNGTWTYEYALRNHNSDRAANRFMVDVPAGVNTSNLGFHDVDYHSGDGWNGITNFDNTDWAVTIGSNDIMWSCADFATNNNANALRWGTLYNYRFTADTPPVAGDITVGMYKGGGRDTINVAVLIPDAPDDPVCPADIADSDSVDPDGVVNVFDLLELLSNWGTGGPGAAISSDGGGAGVVDVFDLLDLLAAWGSCNP